MSYAGRMVGVGGIPLPKKLRFTGQQPNKRQNWRWNVLRGVITSLDSASGLYLFIPQAHALRGIAPIARSACEDAGRQPHNASDYTSPFPPPNS